MSSSIRRKRMMSVHNGEGAAWFWDNTSREEAEQCLRGKRDGTFLVFRPRRNAERVLAFRKSSTNVYKDILSGGDVFGFTEPLGFTSVEELLETFSNTDISTNGEGLLLFPLLKTDSVWMTPTEPSPAAYRETISRLRDLESSFRKKASEHEQLVQDFRVMEQELEGLQSKLQACKTTEQLLNEHVERHNKSEKRMGTDVSCSQRFSDNYQLLRSRLLELERIKKEYSQQCMELQEEMQQHADALQNYEHQLKILAEDRKNMKSWLLDSESKNQTMEFLDGILNDDADPGLPHHNRNLWLIESKNKDEVEKLLKGKTEGTFVIAQRVTRGRHSYELFITHKDTVTSRPIQQINNHYGFDETTCIFESLEELVLKYECISLGVHDECLEGLTLKFPVHYLQGS